MKLTKIALLLIVPAFALLLAGQNVRVPVAEADPIELLTINPTLCVTLTSTVDWDGDGDVDRLEPGVGGLSLFKCSGAFSSSIPTGPDSFDAMVAALRGFPDLEESREIADPDAVAVLRLEEIADNPPTPEDFTVSPGNDPQGVAITPMDSDAGQLHQEDGAFMVLAFVSNDEPVSFYADQGRFRESGSAGVTCGRPEDVGVDADFSEEDCDDDGEEGDGVIVVYLDAIDFDDDDRGDWNLRVRQARLEMDEDYTIVGEPVKLTTTISQPALQTGAATCKLFKNTQQYIAVLNAPEKAALVSKVTDSDGTELTGALVLYEIMTGESPPRRSTQAEFARLAQARSGEGQISLTPTVSSALGIASPNVICGADEPGTFTLRAKISRGIPKVLPGDSAITLDDAARERSVEVEVEVKEPPNQMVLGANPASLVCDGTATSSVTANLTDAAGDPAIKGNVVRYDVKALGTISPIEASSVDGVATTTLTPLTDVARGVTVNAALLLPELTEDTDDLTEQDIEDCSTTFQYAPCPITDEVLEPSDIEGAFLVECTAGGAQGAPAAPGAGAPTISPPSTGDGGYLGR